MSDPKPGSKEWYKQAYEKELKRADELHDTVLRLTGLQAAKSSISALQAAKSSISALPAAKSSISALSAVIEEREDSSTQFQWLANSKDYKIINLKKRTAEKAEIDDDDDDDDEKNGRVNYNQHLSLTKKRESKMVQLVNERFQKYASAFERKFGRKAVQVHPNEENSATPKIGLQQSDRNVEPITSQKPAVKIENYKQSFKLSHGEKSELLEAVAGEKNACYKMAYRMTRRLFSIENDPQILDRSYNATGKCVSGRADPNIKQLDPERIKYIVDVSLDAYGNRVDQPSVEYRNRIREIKKGMNTAINTIRRVHAMAKAKSKKSC